MQQHPGAIANLYRQSFLVDDSLRRSVREYVIGAIGLKLASNSAISIRTVDRKASIFNNKAG